MILVVNKGDQIKISEYFTADRFDCRCKFRNCKETSVAEELAQALDELVERAGELIITSGFRCPDWNARVGGVGGSLHLEGKACDIYSHKYDPNKLAKFAEQIEEFENGGIGIAHNFLHVDIRGYKIRWSYPLPI